MEQQIYHHILYININNKVLSHKVEESKDNINPSDEEAYMVSYNKINQVFRVSYYTYEESRFTVKDYIINTFRAKCNTAYNGINNFAI